MSNNQLYNPSATGKEGKGYNIDIEELKKFRNSLYKLSLYVGRIKGKEICLSDGRTVEEVNKTLAEVDKNKEQYVKKLQDSVEAIDEFITKVTFNVQVNSDQRLIVDERILQPLNNLKAKMKYIDTNYYYFKRDSSHFITESAIKQDFSSWLGIPPTVEEKAELDRALKRYYAWDEELKASGIRSVEYISKIILQLNTVIRNTEKHINLLNINTDNIVTDNMEFSTNLLSDSAIENYKNAVFKGLEFESAYLEGFDYSLKNSKSKLPVTMSMSNRATKYFKFGKLLGNIMNIIEIWNVINSAIDALINPSDETWEKAIGDFFGFIGGALGGLLGGALGFSITGLLGLPSGPGALATGVVGYAGGTVTGSIVVGTILEEITVNVSDWFFDTFGPEEWRD